MLAFFQTVFTFYHQGFELAKDFDHYKRALQINIQNVRNALFWLWFWWGVYMPVFVPFSFFQGTKVCNRTVLRMRCRDFKHSNAEWILKTQLPWYTGCPWSYKVKYIVFDKLFLKPSTWSLWSFFPFLTNYFFHKYCKETLCAPCIWGTILVCLETSFGVISHDLTRNYWQ